jgi:hypothetical protein
MHWPANYRHCCRDTDHDLIEASHPPLKQIHMKILPDKFRGQAEWRRNGQAGYEFHKQFGSVFWGTSVLIHSCIIQLALLGRVRDSLNMDIFQFSISE